MSFKRPVIAGFFYDRDFIKVENRLQKWAKYDRTEFENRLIQFTFLEPCESERYE